MSREIDARVAEKLFGWVWLRHREHDTGPMEPRWMRSLFIPDHEVHWLTPAHGDEPVDTCNAPHYSTDIAAAWQIIPAMEARSFWCSIKSPWEPTTTGQRLQWYAGFTTHGATGWNGRADFYVFADTAPMAICLAALRALNIDTKEGE